MRKRSFFKILYLIFSILFVLSSIMTTVLIISFDKDYASPKFGNFILVSVNDSELSPKVLKGSALLSDLKYDSIKMGDLVIITTKNNHQIQYAARRVEMVEKDYYSVSGTEGRGSFYVSKSSVVAVSCVQFYGVGAYMNIMRTQAGFFGFVIVPLVIIIMIQIIRMISLLQENKYKDKYAGENKVIIDKDKGRDKEQHNEVKG